MRDMKTILVIEDNAEMLDNLAGILELANYKVLTAPNGKAGVDIATRQKPDLILCDVMMPVLDGYGVLHILSNDRSTRNIPFIFLTALGDKSDFRRGMRLGADDYIIKPFDGLELLQAIEMRIKKKQHIEDAVKEGLIDLNDLFDNVHRPPAWEGFGESVSLRVYKKKEIAFIEGRQSTEVFFINKGKMKTYKSSKEGKELITGLHSTGTFIGVAPLFYNSINSETAMALEDSEVYVLQKEEFSRALFANMDAAKKLMHALSSALIETQRRLLEVAYHTVRQRVASTLLWIYERYGLGQATDYVITESRKDLSGIIGTAVESLNRTLADFKDEGLIDIIDSGIMLLDKKRLEKL